MVRFMPSHELILADAAQDGVHDRPLRCRDRPSSLSFRIGKRNRLGTANIGVQFSVFDKHPAPHNFSRLADTLDRAAPQGKVHRGLAFADCLFVSVRQMSGRNRTRDFEYPYKFLTAIYRERLTVANIMKGCLWRKSQTAPNTICY